MLELSATLGSGALGGASIVGLSNDVRRRRCGAQYLVRRWRRWRRRLTHAPQLQVVTLLGSDVVVDPDDVPDDVVCAAAAATEDRTPVVDDATLSAWRARHERALTAAEQSQIEVRRRCCRPLLVR